MDLALSSLLVSIPVKVIMEPCPFQIPRQLPNLPRRARKESHRLGQFLLDPKRHPLLVQSLVAVARRKKPAVALLVLEVEKALEPIQQVVVRQTAAGILPEEVQVPVAS
jgi:hypothetical protein